jgi:hypothetical protein
MAVAERVFKRPTFFDLADGPCELCATQEQGVCSECGAGGILSVGPDDDHFHLTTIDGIPGREAVAFLRCEKCYQARLNQDSEYQQGVKQQQIAKLRERLLALESELTDA